MTSSIALSIVVAARNDNYGGDFLGRLNLFVKILTKQLVERGLTAELIIVEWNPPEDRDPVALAMTGTNGAGVPLRVIHVPKRFHERFPNPGQIPMLEYAAKNVGIRRARGHHILATNPDLIFSNELVAEMGSLPRGENHFYRTDRYDFRGRIAPGTDPEDAIAYAKKHIFQVQVRHPRPWIEEEDLRPSVGMFRRLAGRLRGRWPSSIGITGPQSPRLVRLDDDTGWYGGLHTNTSGDFILASRAAWDTIRGFPEQTGSHIHLDSYACHQLRAIGMQQWLFAPPCMAFHLDHGGGTQRAHRRVAPGWEEDLAAIMRGELGPALNDHGWGLVDERLDESAIGVDA